ncbi:MAG: cell division protein ZapA [Clostridia bacterium]|nr:cell division protein ZapA [Clostridia bacterium]MBR0508477.1 cell division protein ZapA [Clostridia bacterium]MBR0538100.1 cell division protein ZapA [Clostridia bacterium]
MEKQKVEIIIRGQSYTLITDEPAEKVVALAKGLDGALEQLMSGGRLSTQQALVLAAMELANQADANKKLAEKYKSEIADYLEDAERAMIERDGYKRELDKLKEKLAQ